MSAQRPEQPWSADTPAISVQNMLSEQLPFFRRLIKHGRVNGYVILVMMSLPLGIIQNLLQKESVMNYAEEGAANQPMEYKGLSLNSFRHRGEPTAVAGTAQKSSSNVEAKATFLVLLRRQTLER